jgi:hypothetical protein
MIQDEQGGEGVEVGGKPNETVLSDFIDMSRIVRDEQKRSMVVPFLVYNGQWGRVTICHMTIASLRHNSLTPHDRFTA